MPILGSPALTEAERQQLLLKERSLPYGQLRPSTTTPAPTPEQAINAKLQSGQPLDITEAIYISGNYPQVAQQMKSAKAREDAINEKLRVGGTFDIFEAITIAKYAPSTARQVALIERTNLDLSSGKTLDIFEAIAVSKYAPGIARLLNRQQQPQPQQEPVYQRRTITTINRASQKQSQIFYMRLGYPEYGGMYAPFDVPKGATIQSLIETPSGLNVTYEQPAKPGPNLWNILSLGLGSRLLGTPKPGGTVEGLKEFFPTLQTRVGIPSTLVPGAGTTKIPSLSRFLLAKAEGMKPTADYPLSMVPATRNPVFNPQRNLLFAGGFVQLAENMFVPMSEAEPMTSLGNKPPEYIAGYAFGLAVALSPLIISGAEYVHGKYVKPWGERFLTGEYDKAVQAGKPPVAGGFTTGRPAYEYETGFMKAPLVAEDTISGGLGLKSRVVSAITGASPKPLPPGFVGLPTLQEGALISAPYEELTLKGGSLIERTVVPSNTRAWASGMDILDFTNAPGLSGYGLTVPEYVAPYTPLAQEESLSAWILSKWIVQAPGTKLVATEPLSFTKRPQTYRPAEQGKTFFSKEVGKFPTQEGLLEQITAQESKRVVGSGGMPNVFGPSQITIQKSVVSPLASLGELSLWLVGQEQHAKVLQIQRTAPYVFAVPVPQQTRQETEELEVLTFPKQPLVLDVPTRQEQKISNNVVIIGGVGSKVLQSPFQKSKTEQLPRLLRFPFQESRVEVQQQQRTSPIQLTTQKQAVGQIAKTLQIQANPTPNRTSYVTPYRNPLDISNKPVYPKRKQQTREYLFGRQPRRYPILTGRPAYNVLFGQPKKHKSKK